MDFPPSGLLVQVLYLKILFQLPSLVLFCNIRTLIVQLLTPGQADLHLDLGVLEVLEYAQELNALVLHPLHRVAGHVEPAADQLCVGTPVGILHEEVEGVILGVVVGHGLLLELGLNGKEGHAHVGCAADGAGLLKYNNGAAAGGVQGLLGLGCSAEAGHAAAYENNIGFLSISSKGGGGLLKEMERKIEKLKEDMALTVKKIDAIDENLE